MLESILGPPIYGSPQITLLDGVSNMAHKRPLAAQVSGRASEALEFMVPASTCLLLYPEALM